jgi:rsbT co-antagonist protein RsbR
MARSTVLGEILTQHEAVVLRDWVEQQLANTSSRTDLLSRSELQEQARQFLTRLRQAVLDGGVDSSSTTYEPVRRALEELSQARARQGYTPVETATFVFSLKQPLFQRLREKFADNPQGLADALWETTLLIDGLGLLTSEAYQRAREQVIARQQEEMLELSTPVVALWDGILALPLIGTLDSARTQIVMENLLERIVATGASLAVIDITGVPTVDTVTAQHLLKTVAAARLMGADCILSGIRPQIAQTIVHLGVDLGDIMTKATLADAFAVALKRRGLGVQRLDAPGRKGRRQDQEQTGPDQEDSWNASRS